MGRRTQQPTTVSTVGSVARYGDRIFDDQAHDPYQANGKYKEPTVCGDCNAVFHGGPLAVGGYAAGCAQGTVSGVSAYP